MKTTSVSSSAMSNAMRYSQSRMQVELIKRQKEMETLRVADLGLALGARTSQSVTFARDLERLNTIVDSNKLISSRLSTTQDALGKLGDAAQKLLTAVSTAISGDPGSNVTRDAGKAALQSMTSILNSSINGEYLFAGTNTDVKPINDFTAAGSPAKAALDAAFVARFGFASTDPAAANLTGAQLDNFITTDVMPQFFGPAWKTNWSNATDQQIVSRISLNETTESSVSANTDGVKKFAMAAAIVTTLFSGNLNADAKKAVAQKALTLTGEALGSIAQTQSQAGIIEQRVTDASDRMKAQINLFEKHVIDLEGVDEYEAANRVNDLMSHIQQSFALTARLQQLSLINFLK
ncbi:flagellar hook-associated family protein [Mesorhizobium sp. Pch-S]|jgi:flagellar hook-associated protein 3 FlgL|uniref:flagellar hook-associated family protein n=1 Tax=Mesorhizobium sp. Pch-S TaxID=2082387 RepID=UPI001011C5F1|nr:flagellar hook-associated family protein [Mesorhizobium sp. Pch-S]QAZ44605.1 flagellar hook-associated family protein [Mesorhizobium sp. Pch-S]